MKPMRAKAPPSPGKDKLVTMSAVTPQNTAKFSSLSLSWVVRLNNMTYGKRLGTTIRVRAASSFARYLKFTVGFLSFMT